ncbi:MAG: hypothetical protein WAK48_04305 [Candidatus Acidiferrum sp.]|jgi:hypothetical protein
MSNQNVFSTLIVTWVAVPSLAMFLGARPARAQNSSADYAFLVASGFLCDPGDSSTCQAVVKSADGDSYEMSGAGALNTQSKLVQAAGTFTHKAANGTVLEVGVWIVGDLVSFDSYGIAPGTLRQWGVALGPQPFVPKGLSMSFGPMPTGGLAVFHIRLLPMRGATKTAVLQVNCALGDVPREHSVEGIRLTFDSKGNEFSEEVSGRVMFLAMRPEVSTPAKTLQQEPVPVSAGTPNN